jgi:hypothetical protein
MLESVHRIRSVIAALGNISRLDIDPRWQELSPMLDLQLASSSAEATELKATA